MKRFLHWLLLPVVVLVAGTASANDTGYPTGPPSQKGAADLYGVLDEMGAPDDWKTFLAAVAHRESRFDNLAENTSTTEAAAARRAFDRQRDRGRFSSSPWPDSAYTFGSGGWYGLLPANALEAFSGTDLENMDPREAIHDPITSTIMALAYARRLFGWAAFDGTWLGLRVGWANPSKMGDPDFVAEVRGRFRKDLEAIGASPSFMDREVSSVGGLPDSETLFHMLKGGNA